MDDLGRSVLATWRRPNEILIYLSAVMVLVILVACQRDRQFHTVAVYQAPRGQYSIRIDANGVVSAGADLSEQSSATLMIWPPGASGPSRPAPPALSISLRQGQVEFEGEGVTPGSWRGPGGEAVSRLLSDAGYSVVPEELDELLEAVYGVLLGPKGTLMAGQTSVLKVVSTTFEDQ